MSPTSRHKIPAHSKKEAPWLHRDGAFHPAPQPQLHTYRSLQDSASATEGALTLATGGTSNLFSEKSANQKVCSPEGLLIKTFANQKVISTGGLLTRRFAHQGAYLPLDLLPRRHSQRFAHQEVCLAREVHSTGGLLVHQKAHSARSLLARQEVRSPGDSLACPTRGSLPKVCSSRDPLATRFVLTNVCSPPDSHSTGPLTGLALGSLVPVVWSPHYGLHSPASQRWLSADQSTTRLSIAPTA